MKKFLNCRLQHLTLCAPILLTALNSSFVLAATAFKIDATHSSVGFKIKHLAGISTVIGRFNVFSGSFEFDATKGTLEKVETTIDVSSIDTNEKDRDKHLKGKDFFEIEKFPTMTFKSKTVKLSNNKPVEVQGDLMLHGVTKPVTLAVVYTGAAMDPWGNNRVAFEAKTSLNRKDFGMNWNKVLDKGGVMVSDEIEVEIHGEAVAQKPAEKDQKPVDKAQKKN
jgi:polyisoprenoid-binding protein YceI